MARFAGKSVLVTGAAQGMGRTIAERFVEVPDTPLPGSPRATDQEQRS